jgi:hypothetical protein
MSRCGFAYGTCLILLFLNSCRTPDSALNGSQVQGTSAPAPTPAQATIPNGFTTEHLRTHSFQDCGLESSKTKIFVSSAENLQPDAWNDENVWRVFARPISNQDECKEPEYLKENKSVCWRDFALQFYPGGTFGENSRYIVDNISPIWRTLPVGKLPKRLESCNFSNPTALIWVAGVNNPGLGTSFTKTDSELLSSILAWNRNTELPKAVASKWHPEAAGHEKLKDIPGYIQIVQNQNWAVQGIWGKHSEPDIQTMSNNIELAYKAGIETLEIVSHSNGMVTSQLGYALFVRRLKNDFAGFEKYRLSLGRSKVMKVRFYHLQAAPAAVWSGNSNRDSFGFNSDFIPTAKKIGVMAWRWDWDFGSYFNDVQGHLEPEFRFYYNAGDFLTYDDARYTLGANTVGRRESLAWQRDIDTVRVDKGFRAPIIHFVCTETGYQCGPSHDQRRSLWDFVNPMMPKTQKPAEFRVAKMESYSQTLGLNQNVANAAEVLYEWENGQFPESICLSKDSEICQNTKSLDQSKINMPEIFCGEGSNAAHACASTECGDGVCNIERAENCPKDCRVSAQSKVCMCVGDGCFDFGVECSGQGCDLKRTRAENNICSCPSNLAVSCTMGRQNCRVYKTASNGCHLFDLEAIGAGEFRSIICNNGVCRVHLPTPLGIVNAGQPRTDD